MSADGGAVCVKMLKRDSRFLGREVRFLVFRSLASSFPGLELCGDSQGRSSTI